MDSIFTKIINGQIPSYKVGENQYAFAFLDISPLAKGHTLIVPKIQVDNIFDLQDPWFSQLHLFSQQVAKAIQFSIPCLRVGSAVIGLEIPHAHIHLVPLQSIHDLDFSKPKLKLTADEMTEIANRIASNLH